jgi:hypothetical protein
VAVRVAAAAEATEAGAAAANATGAARVSARPFPPLRPAALVLENTFTSISDMVDHVMPLLARVRRREACVCA